MYQADDPGNPLVEIPEQPSKGLTILSSVMLLVGEMAGSGVLAMPLALEQAGYAGIPFVLFCATASTICGIIIGRCWIILTERFPNDFKGKVKSAYPAIGQATFGIWMRYLISVAIDVLSFGVCTVFLLMAAQNIQSLLTNIHVDISFCYVLIILAVVLTPLSWLGTPKDFVGVGFAATLATLSAIIMILVAMLLDNSRPKPVMHASPSFSSFFLSFGAILFSFGGIPVFPSIQQDMKQPSKFPVSACLAYTVMLIMYLPMSAVAFFMYGDEISNNILQNLPSGGLRIASELVLALHLITAFIIVLNPASQDMEELFKIPNAFTWKRCIVRTLLVALCLLIGESIPHFGPLLDLIGGFFVTLLSFILPPIFYMKLCSSQGDWPDRSLSIGLKALCISLIVIGVVGGTASTYSAISLLTSSNTFVPPCFINITAAEASM